MLHIFTVQALRGGVLWIKLIVSGLTLYEWILILFNLSPLLMIWLIWDRFPAARWTEHSLNIPNFTESRTSSIVRVWTINVIQYSCNNFMFISAVSGKVSWQLWLDLSLQTQTVLMVKGLIVWRQSALWKSSEHRVEALLVSDQLFTSVRVWAAWTQFCLRDKKSCISRSWIKHKSGTEDRKDSDLMCGFTFCGTIFTVFSHLYASVSSTARWLCLYTQCLPQLSLASSSLSCIGVSWSSLYLVSHMSHMVVFPFIKSVLHIFSLPIVIVYVTVLSFSLYFIF